MLWVPISTLTSCFTFGWDVCFTSEPSPKDTLQNLISAAVAMDDVDEYIAQVLRCGTLLGPFITEDLPFDVAHSPVGSQKHRSKSRRTIIDCS